MRGAKLGKPVPPGLYEETKHLSAYTESFFTDRLAGATVDFFPIEAELKLLTDSERAEKERTTAKNVSSISKRLLHNVLCISLTIHEIEKSRGQRVWGRSLLGEATTQNLRLLPFIC